MNEGRPVSATRRMSGAGDTSVAALVPVSAPGPADHAVRAARRALRRGEPALAERLARQAIPLALALSDRPAELRLRWLQGQAQLHLGQADAAALTAERLLARARAGTPRPCPSGNPVLSGNPVPPGSPVLSGNSGLSGNPAPPGGSAPIGDGTAGLVLDLREPGPPATGPVSGRSVTVSATESAVPDLSTPDVAVALGEEPAYVEGRSSGRGVGQGAVCVDAEALALLAAANVDRGSTLAGLDALAEALAAVEAHRRSASGLATACAAVAEVFARLLLFEQAARFADRAARALLAVPTGGRRGGAVEGTCRPHEVELACTDLPDLDPLGTAVEVHRSRAQVYALWAAQLELLGAHREAAQRQVVAASAALCGARLARWHGDRQLVDAALAVEAHAQERLGQGGLAWARLLPGLARCADPDGLVEWLPGRLALARALAGRGEHAQATELLDRVVAAGRAQHRETWAVAAATVAADLSLETEGQDAAARSAAAWWRELAASGLHRIWRERGTRLVDLRYRLLRRELSARSERTARALLVDPLTGLGNRRLLDRELRSHRRGGVLFVDIDGFKQINDRCGHETGDRVLRRVAGVLRSCTRDGDVLVRYGGDEFVVLVADGASPASLGERVLQRIRAEDWTPLVEGGSVTVSLGAASVGELPAALRRSDEAMLAAKRSGRNALVQG